MFRHLLRQLMNSFGIFFRTIRAFFTRRLTGLWARLRRMTNFSRHAAKVASDAFQETATALKKPSRREDYIETSRLYISKSFLILLVLGLAALCLMVKFLLWPLFVSHFLTARFYQEDPRVAAWSGRVVVYYDEEKTIPRYSGTLTEGVLQGKGKAYDQEGLLVYDGTFADGLYNGTGLQYEGGVLRYEGQFQDGLYEGSGSLYEDGSLTYQGAFSAGLANGLGTAYADGKPCYEGMFSGGLYDGEGTSYFPGGAVEYKGTFSSGQREGMGTLFYDNGLRSYAGSFAGGLREGEGTAYCPDGQVLYKGAFVQDLYEGAGSLYLEDGGVIRSEFLAGETGGSIQWYQGGRLWYDGEARGLLPEGFGTVYGSGGKVLYAGQFRGGTLDGQWLLSLTGGGLREALGDGVLTEADRGDGFLLQSPDLGLSALCSYQTEDREAEVRQVWFQPKTASLLPWETWQDAEAWAKGEGDAAVSQGPAPLPEGGSGGSWQKRLYRYEDEACLLLSKDEKSPPVQLYWYRMGEMPLPEDSASGAGGASEAQARLESLTEALSQVGGGDGGQAEQGDVARLLGLTLTAEDAEALTEALIDHLVSDRTVQALEANRPLVAQLLSDAQAAQNQGTGTSEAVEAAEERLDQLDLQLTQAQAEREQAAVRVEKLTKLDADDYDLQPVLVLFDPGTLDAAGLYDAALAYEKKVAAGRYEVDTEVLETQVRTAVLSLGSLHESVLSAQRRLDRLAEDLEEQRAAYARGSVSKAVLYDAQCALGDAAATLSQTLGNFSRQAARVNGLTGGWLSEDQGWLSEAFGAVYQGEILRGETAAAEIKEARAQREDAAAQSIQEAGKPEEEAGPQDTKEDGT